MRTQKQKKQNGQRRRSKEGASTSAPRGVVTLASGSNLQFGFPNRVISKLKYSDTYPLSSTAGSIGKQVLYINSTFDPDNTGTGHQPLYRDTFATIYDQYAVVSATIRVTFVTTAVGVPMLVGALIEDDNATSTTANTLIEQSNGQSAMLANATGSPSTHTFVVNWDCKKILQIDPYTSESYKTSITSNPTEVSSLLLWSAPADTASSATTYVHVVMEQVVLWTELATPTQS